VRKRYYPQFRRYLQAPGEDFRATGARRGSDRTPRREIRLNTIAIALHQLIAMIGLQATHKAIVIVLAPGF
jgi:hypothetical protein